MNTDLLHRLNSFLGVSSKFGTLPGDILEAMRLLQESRDALCVPIEDRIRLLDVLEVDGEHYSPSRIREMRRENDRLHRELRTSRRDADDKRQLIDTYFVQLDGERARTKRLTGELALERADRQRIESQVEELKARALPEEPDLRVIEHQQISHWVEDARRSMRKWGEEVNRRLSEYVLRIDDRLRQAGEEIVGG